MPSMQPTSDEPQDLRRCVRDLVALTTLPAIWGNADPPGIGRGLAEVLMRILSVDFVYVRLHGWDGGTPAEAVRTRQRIESAARAHEIGQVLAASLQPEVPDLPLSIPSPVGEGTVRLVVFPIGTGHDYGLLAAGCGQTTFPNDTERLLLSVAVNQAAGLLQRKHTEDALRKQSEWLRVTLSSIGDAVITTDTAGRITSLNPIAESLTGWPEEQARGQLLRTVFRIFNEHDRQETESPALRALREGQIVGLANHTVLLARDGTERAIDDSAAPIKDEQGNILGVVLIFRDVSARRQAARAIAESEARKAAILQTALDCIISCDQDGRVLDFNPAAERTFGYQAAAVVGRDLADLIIPPALRDRHRRGMARYLATNEPRLLNRRIEMKARRADGTEFPIELAITRILLDGPPQFTAYLRDITDRKRANQTTRFLADASAILAELTDYESTLQRLASMAVPQFADWCLVDMQEADGSIRRLAVTHADPNRVALAHEVFQHYPPCRTDSHGVMAVLRTGEPAWSATIPESFWGSVAEDEKRAQIVRSLGLKSYLCVPLRSPTKTVGALTFLTAESGRVFEAADLQAAEDLASRTVIAIENASLLAALRETDRRKDEFLAILAHELRNPLAPIHNALQLVQARGPADPKLQWARDVIDRQLQQLTRLVDDLLDISRITRGKIDLRLERVQLRTVVNSAVEASRPLIDKKGHLLTVTLPPEAVHVHADPTRLAQVLLNLLNNAAKYTEPAGRIWLGVERAGKQVSIRVKDTGIGIPPEMLPRIFEVFTQVDRSLEHSQGGLGIGLTLVRNLVEMHGGVVDAHSDGPGTGSEFVVRLPVALEVETPKAHGAGHPGERAAPPGRCRILVVDDNRDSAESLAMILRMIGNDVQTAHDGLEALGAVAEFQPDVVLLDIGLPKLNGYEVGRRLRQQHGHAVVLIALTGWGQEEDRRRSREAGFDHHLTKPVQFEALQRLLTGVRKAR